MVVFDCAGAFVRTVDEAAGALAGGFAGTLPRVVEVAAGARTTGFVRFLEVEEEVPVAETCFFLPFEEPESGIGNGGAV